MVHTCTEQKCYDNKVKTNQNKLKQNKSPPSPAMIEATFIGCL